MSWLASVSYTVMALNGISAMKKIPQLLAAEPFLAWWTGHGKHTLE